jgi:hypothetical protein
MDRRRVNSHVYVGGFTTFLLIDYRPIDPKVLEDGSLGFVFYELVFKILNLSCVASY